MHISLKFSLSLALALLGLLALAVTPAFAIVEGPQWTVTSVSAPTNFTPGDTSGEDAYRVQVTNTGGAASDGEAVTITDELPAGLQLAAAGATGEDSLAQSRGEASGAKFKCVFRTCTFTGGVVPGQTLTVTFPVDVLASSEESVMNVARVSGGGATDASMSTPTQISAGSADFGVSPGGEVTALSSTQAGAHPDITTSIAFNTVNRRGSLAGDPDDLITEEPPGFAGDLVDTPTCAPAQFNENKCPADTQIGYTTLTLLDPETGVAFLAGKAVYNLTPSPGEVAKFAFQVAGNFDIQGNVTVRPGDYGLRVSFHNTQEAITELDAVSLTVWGVPGAQIHDVWKGISGSPEIAPAPYFTNPTSCESEQFDATFSVNSWEEPERFVKATMPFGPIVGCDRLSLPASFIAEATSEDTDTASGLNVNLGVKQTYENPEGLASSTLDKAVVTLPEGMTVNPSAGAGLTACSLAQYAQAGIEEIAGQGCPNESKLGSVEIVTPALAEKAVGSVYLAEPAPNGEAGKNPFDSLLAIYVVARFPQRGVLVKVAGKVSADPQTGRLVTTFAGQPELAPLPNGETQPGLPGLPPVPFTTFTFKFHQGTTSPLVTPPLCGSYAASVALSPWSEPLEALFPESHSFSITHGVGGGVCPSGGVPPFAPRVVSGVEDNAAGAYSPFYLRILREDGEQEITKFTTILPPGLTGNLSGIPFCSDASIEAARGVTGAQELEDPSCPAASEIGHTVTEAGVGSTLAQAPGKVYLAGPYHGAPLSVVSITAAKVGPFDLGTVVIRFALSINPLTAQVEINGADSDPIPHIIKGIVVHVRDVRAYINRQKFILNPTSCDPLSISDTITGAGADPANPADQSSVPVSTPFQAADCSNLKFQPTFKVSTSGKTSRTQGASLSVKLSYPTNALGTQANIKSVKVDLPKQLPSRLTTLQKACTAAQFDANPAGCPVDSRVGQAKAITPILPVPLEGPAYFVSYGGAKFPELVIVLQGYGFTIDLHGETFISKAGITSSTFHAVPDEPVSSFELQLPEGPFSALAATGNLCTAKLTMPTAFTAHNGEVIHKSTPISTTGCPKHKRKSAKKTKRSGKHKKKK